MLEQPECLLWWNDWIWGWGKSKGWHLPWLWQDLTLPPKILLYPRQGVRGWMGGCAARRWVKCWLETGLRGQWLMGCASQTVLYLLLGCVLFNTFINGLEEVIQCILIKFADDKCLRAGLPFLGRLEKWANRNPIKFSKYKCWVLSWRGRALDTRTDWDCLTGEQLCSKMSMYMNVHQHLHCSSNRPLPMECLAEVI